MRVLQKGLHRIRHYGLFANGSRIENLAMARAVLDANAATTEPGADAAATEPPIRTCPCRGGRMHILETFVRGETELSSEVGDGGNREGGISWGCLTTSLLPNGAISRAE